MEQILLLLISAFLSFLYGEISQLRRSVNDLENKLLKVIYFLPKRNDDDKGRDSKMS